MQVILLEDMYNLGKSGELVTVRDGYARNYLFPKRIALLANAKNIRQLNHEKAVIVARHAKLKSAAEVTAKELSKVSVKITRRVGEQDKLYGSVTALDIAEALNAKGQKIERRLIHLLEPIRQVGTFGVEVRLHSDVRATIQVEVAPE